jgi:hypothetical protein
MVTPAVSATHSSQADELDAWSRKRGSPVAGVRYGWLGSSCPVVVGEKDLRHVPCHERKVGTECRRRRGIAVNPGDLSGLVLRLSDLKRCLGWVDTHDSAATFRQPPAGYRGATGPGHGTSTILPWSRPSE